MSVEVVVFVVFAIVALAGAFTMVTARNPVYSALGLLSAMFAVAVFYVMNDAHFVAAVQVLIYAGAVMTLFLFVIMMIGVDKIDDRSEQIPFQRPIGLVLGGGLLALVLLAARAAWVTGFAVTADGANLIVPEGGLTVDLADGSVTPDAADFGVGTIEAVSRELFDAWLLPFEATVLLLTIAAIATVALAQFGPETGTGHRTSDNGQRTVVSDPKSEVQGPESYAEPEGSA